MTVLDLLYTVLPRLAGEKPQAAPFLEAVKMVQDIVTRRLWLLRSDLLEEDFSASVRAGSSRGWMGDDVLGLKTGAHPWVIYDGQRYDLVPLPDGMKDRTTLAAPGRPSFYRLRGLSISVYPTPDLDIHVKGEAYVKPLEVAEMTDEIPWFGLFDPVFVETVARFGVNGLGSSVAPEVALFIHQWVDQIALQRPSKCIRWRHPA